MTEEKGLQVFSNEKFGQVRTKVVDNEPWFVVADVCKALEIGNPSDAVKRLDDDERMTIDSIESHLGQRGGAQSINIINEAGLYSLVLGSRKAQAKEFKRWVTHDVIPAIRKTGGYVNNEEAFINSYFPSVDETTKQFMIHSLIETKETQRALAAEKLKTAQQTQIIGELKPKADYCDEILKSKNALLMTQIAKDYGMSAKMLNKTLHEYGVQYKMNGQWLLYSKYQDKGYTKSETIFIQEMPYAKLQTKWTQKGRLFLYEILKKNKVLPLIEQEQTV